MKLNLCWQYNSMTMLASKSFRTDSSRASSQWSTPLKTATQTISIQDAWMSLSLMSKENLFWWHLRILLFHQEVLVHLPPSNPVTSSGHLVAVMRVHTVVSDLVLDASQLSLKLITSWKQSKTESHSYESWVHFGSSSRKVLLWTVLSGVSIKFLLRIKWNLAGYWRFVISLQRDGGSFGCNIANDWAKISPSMYTD